MRRGKTGTSLQHKMKSPIHHRVDPRISDSGASKVVGVTPGEPLCLLIFRSEQPARGAQRIVAVSRGHKSRKGNEPGVVADGKPVRRRIRRTHRDKGPNGALCRRAQVNESGKFRKPDRTDPAPGEYPGAEEHTARSARAALCPLRRRLCHLRPKRSSRETGDEISNHSGLSSPGPDPARSAESPLTDPYEWWCGRGAP